MRILLLHERRKDEGRVQQTFEDVFQGLLAEAPQVRSLPRGAVSGSFLHLPVDGWRSAFFEEDAERWALATEYPLNARRVLASRGVQSSAVLLDLSRALEESPEECLRELAPPFALVWGDKQTGVVSVQNDGLGMAQLFELRTQDAWALASRIHAFRAVGHELRPVREEWATRFAIDWFPGSRTGWRDVWHLEPGTRLWIDANGVHRHRYDVLRDWVCPDPRPPADCLERARASVLELLEDGASHWECPTLGLSGGWDSRLVAACVRHLGLPCDYRVRGGPERLDVRISSELARVAGLSLRIKPKGGWPADDSEGCRQSVLKALVWQAGAMTTKRHKLFLAHQDGLTGGAVNLMGQHGGLGKADFVVKTRALEHPVSSYEDRLTAKLTQGAPAFLKGELHGAVEDAIRSAYRAGEAYGLEGLGMLHFFFLHEYTRRWASGAIASQPGVVCAPILNPEFIRAAYAMPPERIWQRPFHRFIIETLAPEWARIPFEDRTTPEELDRLGIAVPKLEGYERKKVYEKEEWKRPTPHKTVNSRRFWKLTGRPLLLEALQAGRFAAELFDVSMLEEKPWRKKPDPLVVAHLLPDSLR